MTKTDTRERHLGRIAALALLGVGACADTAPRSCPAPGCAGADAAILEPDGQPGVDASPPPMCAPASVCADECCTETTRCWQNMCIRNAGSCENDEACEHDSSCLLDVCVPFGTPPLGDQDARCTTTATVDGFVPVLQCAYTTPTDGVHPERIEVASTPMVANFGLPSGRPSIVFGTAAGWDLSNGTMRVIDGATCELVASLTPDTAAGGAPALADITGDGRPDIVAMTPTGGLMAFSYDDVSGSFVQLWRSGRCDGAGGRTPDDTGGSWMLTGPSIHDLDDDGIPEIVHCNKVYTADGCLVGESVPWSGFYGQAPVIADVDEDGRPELVEANTLYEYDPLRRDFVPEPTFAIGGSTGAVAVGDLGDFPLAVLPLENPPEIVVVSGGNVRVQTIEGAVVFGPISLPGGGQGAPTIADFDGDGRAEFAAAGAGAFVVFDLDEPDGILWQQPSQDRSSGFTGSSVFDFAADGSAEAVYADECFLRAYDGATGRVIISLPNSSGTAAEYPIVADVDGDFRSELVVASNSANIFCPEFDPLYTGPACVDALGCAPGQTCPDGFCRVPYVRSSGIKVYADRNDAWAGSRPIWNQYAYAVTHVRDDGTVPRTSEVERNWQVPGLNNFRQNVLSGLPANATPDLTVRDVAASDCAEEERLQPLAAWVCNRGTLPAAAGVVATFHVDSADGPVLCTVATTDILTAGSCTRVDCTWVDVPLAEEHDVWVVVDGPDASLPIAECHEDNNATWATAVRCPPAIL